MPTATPLVRELRSAPGTHSALLAPSPELAACVRAYVCRDTRGAILSAEQRCNHFPPTPTCVITWFLDGHDTRLDEVGLTDIASRLPVVFCGPHQRISRSQNPGPVQFFTLLIYPDAVQAMTGLNIALHMERYSAFDAVFDTAWQTMASAVQAASDDASRVHIIEAFLAPRWRAVAPAQAAAPQQFNDWSHGIAHRAHHANRHDSGTSERQIDRRIKSWTGQALRQLRGIGRTEALLFLAQDAFERADYNWASIAAASGFADQAHLCRELRRITGLRPGELRQRLNDESYWMYQVWAKLPDASPPR